MKTANLILALTVSFTFLHVSIASATNGNEKDVEKSNNDPESRYIEAEKYFNTIEVTQVSEDLIRIYDEYENLVASGSVDNAQIIKYLNVSDYLTEIQGVRFYRVSYKTPVDRDIHLVTR